MGSCVSKKAARAGAVAGARGSKVAAPLPAAEKESARHALPPPVAEADVEREEVKEVVLSETPVPRPPRPPPPEPVKRSKEQPEAESEEAASETCSASDTASVESAAKAKLQKKPGAEREPEKKVVSSDAPKKKGRTMAPEETERESKPRGGGGGAGTGRARSPSPSSAHRRQQQQHPPAPPRPRREHPHVVSGIGCRSGRFSPSAARRAAESVVRRTHSAREADMALPSSKRSLTAAINGGTNAGGYGGALSRRDPGERSGRRSDSPTGSRRAAPASPSATHRPASPMRKAAAKEHGHGTPERASRPRVRDGGGDEQPPALAGLGERKKVAEDEEGAALGQNPSVAMECFIFL